MMYNSSNDVFQGCTPSGWMAFHHVVAADACTTSGTAGTACADGTIYAGSVSGVRIYTTPADQSATAVLGAYMFITGVNSLTDGPANTNALYAHIMAGDGDGNPDDGFLSNGVLQCYNLVAHGHSDWYLPADSELSEMVNNSALIGGFLSGYYLSSTEYSLSGYEAQYVMIRQYPGGAAAGSQKDSVRRVRCARR